MSSSSSSVGLDPRKAHIIRIRKVIFTYWPHDCSQLLSGYRTVSILQRTNKIQNITTFHRSLSNSENICLKFSIWSSPNLTEYLSAGDMVAEQALHPRHLWQTRLSWKTQWKKALVLSPTFSSFGLPSPILSLHMGHGVVEDRGRGIFRGEESEINWSVLAMLYLCQQQ